MIMVAYCGQSVKFSVLLEETDSGDSYEDWIALTGSASMKPNSELQLAELSVLNNWPEKLA